MKSRLMKTWTKASKSKLLRSLRVAIVPAGKLLTKKRCYEAKNLQMKKVTFKMK